MKINLKKILIGIAALALILPVTVSVASSTIFLNQGGTGLSTSTLGDLLAGTSSTASYSRIPVGPDGWVLTSSSTAPNKVAYRATSTLGISGGGGTPGGSSGDIQFNNSGAFGGETLVPLVNGGTALSNTITTLTTNGTITAMPVATSIIRYNSTTGATIEGIATTTGSQRIILQSAFGGIPITLKNQNTGAATTTRLELQNGQDLSLVGGSQVELFYNTVDQRWEQSDFRSPVGVTNGLSTQNLFSNAGGIPTGVGDIVFGNGAAGAGTYNGSNGIVFGTNAARFAGNSNDLIAIGNGACQGAGTGSGENICIGTNAGSSTSSGGNNAYGGAATAENATTANENAGWGADDFLNLTTGAQNVAAGFDTGGTNTDGNGNIDIGAGTQSGSAHLSNTLALGNSVRPTLSNTADIGGTSDPLNVGIDNDAAAYPLDVHGNINTTGEYLVNGVPQTPWSLFGNSGTSPGSNYIGTTDATDLYIDTNSTPIEIIKSTGLTGFQQMNPGAIIDAGILPVTVGSPASSFPALIFATPGYSFGSGNKNYSIYGYTTIDGNRVYSASPNNFTFTEPSSSAYDPSGGSASFTGGSGYTASGYDFSYTVWALYGGQTMISVNSANVSDTGGDPNDGSQYNVSASWGAPAGSPAPDAYLVQINGSNPNSGQYQVVSGTSFTDTNSGWGSSASYSGLTYQMQVSYTSGSGATGYRVLNTSATTYFDDTTPTQTVIDDSTWTSGSTVTPTTGSYPSLISEGTTELVTNGIGLLGFFGGSAVAQQTGDLAAAFGGSGYNLVTSLTLNASALDYSPGGQALFSGSTMFYLDGSTFADLNSHTFNFAAGAGVDPFGNLTGTSLILPQISTPGSLTGKLYWSTASDCLTFNTGCVLLNSIDLSGGSGQVTNILGRINGGTGFSTYAKGDMLFATTTNVLAKLAIGSTGQVMSVSSAGLPSWSTFSGPCGTPTDQINLTAATSSLATCTPTATTTLVVSPYLTVNSIATDVEQVQVVYTDETNTSRTQTLLTTSGLSSISTTGAFMFAPISIRVKANSAVTVSTVLTTSIGSISYDAGASLKYDR